MEWTSWNAHTKVTSRMASALWQLWNMTLEWSDWMNLLCYSKVFSYATWAENTKSMDDLKVTEPLFTTDFSTIDSAILYSCRLWSGENRSLVNGYDWWQATTLSGFNLPKDLCKYRKDRQVNVVQSSAIWKLGSLGLNHANQDTTLAWYRYNGGSQVESRIWIWHSSIQGMWRMVGIWSRGSVEWITGIKSSTGNAWSK